MLHIIVVNNNPSCFPPPPPLNNLLFYLTYHLKGQLALTYIETYLPTIYLLEATYGSLFASSSPNKGCCCQIMTQGIAWRISKIALPPPSHLINTHQHGLVYMGPSTYCCLLQTSNQLNLPASKRDLMLALTNVVIGKS
jgi:hypothetical protein